MIRKPCNAFFADDDILFDEYSVNATFANGEMGILCVVLIILISRMLIFMKMILKLLFMSDFWIGTINLNNKKHLKK